MRSFCKLLAAVLCLALVSPAGAAKKDDKSSDKSSDKAKEAGSSKDKKDKKDKGKKEKKPDPGETPASAAKPDEKPKLALPLVEGHDSKGLKIPYYDTQGNLQMVFNIGLATRLDDENVKMSETQVETYNEEGEPEMTVNLPVSTLNLNTRVITSETKTTIKREDFVITGDAVRFNTMTKEGTLVGNVHMTIFNLNDELPSPPSASTPDEASSEPSPAAPASNE